MTPTEIQQWLWSRCHDDGDCVIWDGAVAQGSGPAVSSPYTGRTTPARRVLLQALGVDIKGKIATTTCGNSLCMAKEHSVAWTRKELQKRSGIKLSSNIVRNAKIAAATRARSYLTMEVVRAIRCAGMTATQASQHWNIPLQTVARVLRNDSWKEYGANPFHGLGAMAANDSKRRRA